MMEAVYRVKYEDSTQNGNAVDVYSSEEEAEKAIAEELDDVMHILNGYNCRKDGRKTTIWVPGGKEFASWERLW